MHKAQSWHPADIIALARRWPKGEKIIADFLNVSPADIWPSRYRQKIY
ncbi:helix-turn-helix domain-containing protein [Morganella morganii]